MLLSKYKSKGDLSVLDMYAEIDGFNPLLASTELDKIDCMKVCAGYGANLEWRTIFDNKVLPGATASHLACHYGRIIAVNTLIELNCDIRAKTVNYGSTALHIAVKSGNSEIIRLLLRKIEN